MNALDKLIKRAGQFAKFIFVFNDQAARQITLTLSDVAHGTPHGGQWAHQHSYQQGQQYGNRCNGNKHCYQSRSTEFREWSVSLVFIDGLTDIPISWQTRYRGEGNNALLPIELHVLKTLLDLQ